MRKKSAKSKGVSEPNLFGTSPVLEGEDADAYDELLARIYAAVGPTDFIDRMFVNDIGYLQWDILRLRRLKTGLIRSIGSEALKKFLDGSLDYDLYKADFEESLAEALLENISKDQSEQLARELARKCAGGEPDAIEKVDKCLDAARLDKIEDDAKDYRVEELAQAYARREPDVIDIINKLLASRGQTVDDFVARAVAVNGASLTTLERVDHLITVAEARRNAMLREIERRRAVLGGAMRQALKEVDGEYKVIEKTPTKGMSAA